jgi:hypothetical protein
MYDHESHRAGNQESLCWRGPAAIYWTGVDSRNIDHCFAMTRRKQELMSEAVWEHRLEQWYSTFSVRVPPDINYLQLCTPKVVGV